MLETITAVNQAVNSFIWGIPAMVCIIGVGLLLSVRTGFLQLRKFPYAIKTTIGLHLPQKGCLRRRDDSVPSSVYGAGRYRRHRQHRRRGRRHRHRRAGCGVLDVVLGSAGHVYQVLRSDAGRAFSAKRNKNGELVGGPMYYIKNGLGSRWQFLAVLYSLFGVLTVFGTGNATQVNTIVTAIDSALLAYGSSLNSILPTVNLVVGVVVP